MYAGAARIYTQYDEFHLEFRKLAKNGERARVGLRTVNE
jgi:hypothetical protein